jgi:hypothetical protein
MTVLGREDIKIDVADAWEIIKHSDPVIAYKRLGGSDNDLEPKCIVPAAIMDSFILV